MGLIFFCTKFARRTGATAISESAKKVPRAGAGTVREWSAAQMLRPAVVCLPALRPHWATGRVLLRDMRRIELVDAQLGSMRASVMLRAPRHFGVKSRFWTNMFGKTA